MNPFDLLRWIVLLFIALLAIGVIGAVIIIVLTAFAQSFPVVAAFVALIIGTLFIVVFVLRKAIIRIILGD